MKHIKTFSLLLLSFVLLWGCKKDDKYPGGKLSPYIALFDLRNLDKGQEVTLTTEALFGASKISGLVVSDHAGGNMPAGLLVVQDRGRLGLLRGISIPVGDAAASYLPGDSLVINVEGAVLKRVNGILQLTGIPLSNITKVSSGHTLTPNTVRIGDVLASLSTYESTLVTVTKALFDLSYPEGTTFAGDRTINDGFGNMTLHTEAGMEYADSTLPFMSNFTGLVFGSTDAVPQLRPRSKQDIMVLAAKAPKLAPIVISGYLADPGGPSDSLYEYVQLMATRDIDFSVTPFAIVTTNNAGASTPTGVPVNGWATGGRRTYKINLTAGTVAKGEYFYIGYNKNIWGDGSTDISSAKWFTKKYGTDNGDDFGAPTPNLLANSGNAAGIAVFDKTTVDAETVPVDVIFYGGNGTVFSAGPPPMGYRITNTDYYDMAHPTTLLEQPFYAMGSNTGKLGFAGANFSQLGGTYNLITGRWSKARVLKQIPLSATSSITEIEGATAIEE